MKRLGYAASIFALSAVMLVAGSDEEARAAPVSIFQSTGELSDFAGLNLETFGAVDFGVPLAKLFGRQNDPANTPLAEADRYNNDFRDTIADAAFLSSSSYLREDARGITFKLGEFDNPDFPTTKQFASGLTFSVNVPQQIGLMDRRVHLQFGAGKAAGGDADIGGGNEPAGRKAVLRARVDNVPPNLKAWGQFINGAFARFDLADTNGDGQIDAGEEANLRQLLFQGIAKRKGATSVDDPRLALYKALVDRTQFVDPIESFYLDLANDDGSAFELDVTVLFFNNLFPNLAQFVDTLTLEVGVPSDFPLVYDDVANNAYVGAPPVVLDLQNAVEFGFTVGSGDLVTPVPLPAPVALLATALVGLSWVRVRRRLAAC